MTIVVPHDRLRPETLRALLEEFVTRDGAVQGHTDTVLEDKIAAVQRQLASGKAVIVFDQATETASIRLAADLPRGPGAGSPSSEG
jgi:uncharacterized protein